MIVATALPSLPGHHPILAGAPPVQSLHGLFAGQPLEAFEGGSAIFWQGDRSRHVFEVLQGVLRLFRILPDGRRIIVGFIQASDLLGLAPDERYPYTAEAVNEIRLRRLDRRRFRELTEASPALSRQFVASLCEELAVAQDQMMLLARRGAEERVCSFLLRQAQRAAQGSEPASSVPLPMSRMDIADHLGLTIETVSRTITNLTQRGVIAPSGRHALAIRRPATLARLAGADDGPDTRRSGTGPAQQAAWPQ
ncbi:helix-turn-helix domain-containing protein [Bosea sp. (in: a-proteobacteria)]|uniref:helix-turn-helix domain-containing protein n=1 Tax=Bosea sp. (in: a-proteobacteria) TaxID=1871050 RepID=UPI002FC971EE